MHWLLWIVLLLSVFPAMGQREMTASDRLRPQWMHKLPVPSNLSFVYVVEKADGRTLEEAREACLLRLADNRQLMNTVHATAERDMEEEVRQRFVNGRLQERIDNRSTVRVKVRGGEVDTERCAVMLVDEFRACKWGRITLERPPRREDPAEGEDQG